MICIELSQRLRRELTFTRKDMLKQSTDCEVESVK